MLAFRKALQIFRTHGALALAGRAVQRVRRTVADRAQAYVQRNAWNRLTEIGPLRPVAFSEHDQPVVSVIVPVYNHVQYTATCLNALLRESEAVPYEVIVVDDGSTDGTADYLSACSGLSIVKHAVNQGFVHSVNDGAAIARGRYLHFLNNDTIVTTGWLPALLRAFGRDERIAAVGSQLRSPNGSISEAGALVWNNGDAANFGRGRDASHPSVNFPREVDYCSGASLAVRADRFFSIGGFSAEFAPGYYEDVDLCFRLRAAGYRIMYEPESVVMHFEGRTSGTNTSSGAKRHQVAHRQIFVSKWRVDLENHCPPDATFTERAARRLAGRGTILVVDSFIPFDDRSAGAQRIVAIMRLMRECGYHVLFVAEDGSAYEPYSSRLRSLGVEVILHTGDALSSLQSLPVPIDIAWISRPELAKKYIGAIRAYAQARIIYDTVDAHFVRLQREQHVTGRKTHWENMQSAEFEIALLADAVVVTQEDDAAAFLQAGVDPVVIPIIESPVPNGKPYAVRRDVLFLGNYSHQPNVDAANWLVREVMPLVWAVLPHVRLVLAGAEPTAGLRRLASDRVTITGFVPDLLPLTDAARVFVAPLRFGAGMKGKVIYSLAHGLPVVTTSVGAEGIGLTDGHNAMIRDDAAGIASAIAQVYHDEQIWNALAAEGMKAAERFAPAAVGPQVRELLQAVRDLPKET